MVYNLRGRGDLSTHLPMSGALKIASWLLFITTIYISNLPVGLIFLSLPNQITFLFSQFYNNFVRTSKNFTAVDRNFGDALRQVRG